MCASKKSVRERLLVDAVIIKAVKSMALPQCVRECVKCLARGANLEELKSTRQGAFVAAVPGLICLCLNGHTHTHWESWERAAGPYHSRLYGKIQPQAQRERWETQTYSFGNSHSLVLPTKHDTSFIMPHYSLVGITFLLACCGFVLLLKLLPQRSAPAIIAPQQMHLLHWSSGKKVSGKHIHVNTHQI